jgi:hypothetical protein
VSACQCDLVDVHPVRFDCAFAGEIPVSFHVLGEVRHSLDPYRQFLSLGNSLAGEETMAVIAVL